MDEGRPHRSGAAEPAFALAERPGRPRLAPPEPAEPPLRRSPSTRSTSRPIEPRRPGRGTIATRHRPDRSRSSRSPSSAAGSSSRDPRPTPRPEPLPCGHRRRGPPPHDGREGRRGRRLSMSPASSSASRPGRRTGPASRSRATTRTRAPIYVLDAADAAAKSTIVYDSADVPPFYAYWSPDGRQIAFLAQEPDRIALEVAPADGSAKAEGRPRGRAALLGLARQRARRGPHRAERRETRSSARSRSTDVGGAGAAQRRALPLAGGQPRPGAYRADTSRPATTRPAS
mgnify:CR=1 FL=1